jgi:hypothetical protein
MIDPIRLGRAPMITKLCRLAAMVASGLLMAAAVAAPSFAQEAAGVVPNPNKQDMFQLNDLETFRKFSQLKNFEIVGHSYFRGPWMVPGASGSGVNTLRICGNVAYLAGYNPTVYGVLLVDISNPADMQVLSFIPANAGTRSAYLRVDCGRKILAMAHSGWPENPNKPTADEPLKTGITLHDVTDPRNPKRISEYNNAGGATHGMEMDDQYVYLCGTTENSKPRDEELMILDYTNPTSVKLAATWHVTGQHKGENFSEMNQKNPNGQTDQFITCHEIIKDGNRLYMAYRDAGVIILDITDRTKPVEVGTFDFVPPYNGDPGMPLGCCPGAHTAAPVPHEGKPLPTLLVLTDEHFSCPPGFGQVLDISEPKRMMVLSTYRIEEVDDQYDQATGKFVCKQGQQSTHLPWFDPRSHGALVYQAWYDQGLRAIDISNPFKPKEVGYYISPDFSIPQQAGRHTREAYTDPATNLIYVTDGNGGGIAVLRYTGPMPSRPPIPGGTR